MRLGNPRTRQGQTYERLLVHAAEEMFAAQGFAQTPLSAVARAVSVNLTVPYHYFGDKAGLFRAVFVRKQAGLAVRMIRAAASVRGDPWKALEASCLGYVEGGLDSTILQIAFVDGPRVLGLDVVRDIEAPYALALIREELAVQIRAGRVVPQAVEALSRSVLNALFELASGIARSKTPPAAFVEAKAGLSRLLYVLSNNPN